MIASHGMINPALLLIGSGTGLYVSFCRIHSYIAQIGRKKNGLSPVFEIVVFLIYFLVTDVNHSLTSFVV